MRPPTMTMHALKAMGMTGRSLNDFAAALFLEVAEPLAPLALAVDPAEPEPDGDVAVEEGATLVGAATAVGCAVVR